MAEAREESVCVTQHSRDRGKGIMSSRQALTTKSQSAREAMIDR